MQNNLLTRAKKIYVLFILTLTSLSLAAQTDNYPEPKNYRLDTLRNQKWAANLNIALGAFADGEGGDLNPTTGGAYAYARYHFMKRLTFAAMSGMIPIKIGNADLSKAFLAEGRVSFNFRKKLEASGENFKLGQDGEMKYSANVPITAGTLTGLTGSVSINKRMHTESNSPSHNWTVTEIANPSNTIGQSVATTVFVQQFGIGLFMSRSINFKGRFFLHTKNGGKSRMIRRKRSSMDVAIEYLIAPVITVAETPLLVGGKGDADIVNKYRIDNVNKKYTGWRIQTHVRKGIFAIYMEIGGRPGVYFNMTDDKPSDIKVYLRPMNGFFIRMGLGIGIGTLGTN